MPERYHRDSYSTSYGAGSRRERPEGTQRTRVTIDYDHGSSYNRQRYRDGASGSAAGSGSGGRSNASSILGNYGTGANTSGYNSSSSYGATPNFSNTSGFGRASAYDGGASYGGNTSYGSGYRNKTSHGNSSSYGSKPSYSNSSNYRGSSAYGHAGHNRPVVSPWESGMAPTAAIPVANHGGFLPTPEVSGTSVAVSPATDIIGAVSQLTQMGSTQSALALNILNAVLNRESGDARQPDMDVGPPASKMRRIEWGGGQGNRQRRTLSSTVRPSPIPVSKFPQRDHQYNPRRSRDESFHRGRGGHSYGSAGRHIMTDNQFRKTSKIKRGRPRPDTKDIKAPAKDQKEKNEATPAASTEAASGQKGNKPEGDGSSATTLSKQSGTKDVKKDAGTADDKGKAEKNDASETGEENKIKAKKEPFIPNEILRCYMCDVDNFNSVECYQRHLDAKAHSITAEAYHAQGSAILDILRADAKLASQRQILASTGKPRGPNLIMCDKCQCVISGSRLEHNKTVEHRLVSNHLKLKCCGHAYTTRAAVEEHRLSVRHFKWQMEREKEIKEMEKTKVDDEEGLSDETILNMFYDAVEQHKVNNCEETLTSKTLPPHDPAVPVGLHLIGMKSHYSCNVCPRSGLRMVDEKQVKVHFRSIFHYQNLFAYFAKLQEEKDKERKKKQREERRKEPEKGKMNSDKPSGDKESEEETEGVDGAVKKTADEGEEDKTCEAMDVESSDAKKDYAKPDEFTVNKSSKKNQECKEEADADVTIEMVDELEMLEEVGETFGENDGGRVEVVQDDVEEAEDDGSARDIDEKHKESDSKFSVVDNVDDESHKLEVDEAPIIEEKMLKKDKAPAKTSPVTSHARRARGRGRGRAPKK